MIMVITKNQGGWIIEQHTCPSGTVFHPGENVLLLLLLLLLLFYCYCCISAVSLLKLSFNSCIGNTYVFPSVYLCMSCAFRSADLRLAGGLG